MFFILSKVLNFLIKPMLWIVASLLISLFLKSQKWKKRLLRTGILLLLIFSNEPILDLALKFWEYETITADNIEEPYDVMILLGGYSNPYLYPSHDRFNLGPSANRLMNGLELYFDGKVKKILLTGGRADIAQKDRKEALATAAFLQKMGIPDEDIIVEPESRNTHENAAFTKALTTAHFSDSTTYLLVTSAFHMRRSMACFDKVELDYTPYATDFMRTEEKKDLKYWLLPSPGPIVGWSFLIKEWVGFIVYKTVGYA